MITTNESLTIRAEQLNREVKTRRLSETQTPPRRHKRMRTDTYHARIARSLKERTSRWCKMEKPVRESDMPSIAYVELLNSSFKKMAKNEASSTVDTLVVRCKKDASSHCAQKMSYSSNYTTLKKLHYQNPTYPSFDFAVSDTPITGISIDEDDAYDDIYDYIRRSSCNSTEPTLMLRSDTPRGDNQDGNEVIMKDVEPEASPDMWSYSDNENII